jgi:hypothetical protein
MVLRHLIRPYTFRARETPDPAFEPLLGLPPGDRQMPTAPDTTVRYDPDLYAWLINNAGLLRADRLGEIDPAQIAEGLDEDFWPS